MGSLMVDHGSESSNIPCKAEDLGQVGAGVVGETEIT